MINKVQTGYLSCDLDPQDVGPRLAFISSILILEEGFQIQEIAWSLPSREGPHYCLSTWFLTK